VPRLLDLCSGKWGWSVAFAAREWTCVGVDIVKPLAIPKNCNFLNLDLLSLNAGFVRDGHFDFAVASTPCNEFSLHGLKMWHPNPEYPAMGIKLFNHAREILEESGIPYVMENVRSAQKFVGNAIFHCGSYFLWGNSVPPLLPQGISKAKWRPNKEHGRDGKPGNFAKELRLDKRERAALFATIPIELSNCVADYAERIIPCSTKLAS
jgi:hypothetical protein